MITASEAIKRLKEGNQRFVSGVRSIDTIVKQIKRADFIECQASFAIILGCSDARVPAEIIFDQGLGDLFVIRVAGNCSVNCKSYSTNCRTIVRDGTS